MPHISHRQSVLPALFFSGLALLATLPAAVAHADEAQDAYAAKRALLKGDDQGGRYTLLLKFYYANEKNPAAVQFSKTEAEQLAKDFPDSTQIKTLVRVITAGATHAVEPEVTPGPTGDPVPEPGADKKDLLLPAAPAVGLLSPKDQNLLRLYELDFVMDHGHPTGSDARASVAIPKEVVEDLLKNNPDAKELAKFSGRNAAATIRNLPPLAQLDLIFAVQDKTLYSKIEVRTEPATLRTFRMQIHAQLMHYFTPNFAGQVPGLIAKPKSASGQQEAYTNFLALSLATVNGHPVIDRADPADSLLLQWGLPRADAKYPAPNIKGWKPYFRSAKDPRFAAIAEWIKDLYGETAPNYGIGLPPAPGAAGKPGDAPDPGTGAPPALRHAPPPGAPGPAGRP